MIFRKEMVSRNSISYNAFHCCCLKPSSPGMSQTKLKKPEIYKVCNVTNYVTPQ